MGGKVGENSAALRAAVFFAILEKPEGGAFKRPPPAGRGLTRWGRPAGRQVKRKKRHVAARPISVEIFETLIGFRHAGNTSRYTLSAALCEVLCDDYDCCI